MSNNQINGTLAKKLSHLFNTRKVQAEATGSIFVELDYPSCVRYGILQAGLLLDIQRCAMTLWGIIKDPRYITALTWFPILDSSWCISASAWAALSGEHSSLRTPGQQSWGQRKFYLFSRRVFCPVGLTLKRPEG